MSSIPAHRVRSKVVIRSKRQRPTSCTGSTNIQARDREGLPWILLPVSGPAELKLPTHRDWQWPDAWGESLTGKGSWLIPRDRFTATSELLAEQFAFVDIYMQFNKGDCVNAWHTADLPADCTCSCFGWTPPSLGWNHTESVAVGEEVEIHAVLFDGHSLDGMFA
jgi:hypothetical protein